MSNQVNKIKEIINKYKIISFDIFDTLLLRPYIKPWHAFKVLEEKYSLKSFSKTRIDAELSARLESKKEEITLDDIYEYMPLKYKKYKDIELKIERDTLFINQEIKTIYDYTKKLNKKIIITSDMYLPKDFIKEVLSKNGYVGFEKLYLSSEYNLTKSSGNLFKQIINDYKEISPEEILHIGDNPYSDFKKAKKNKLHAFLYVPPMKAFMSQNKGYEDFYNDAINSIEKSVILSLNASYFVNKNKEENLIGEEEYFKNLGYKFGLIAYGYCRFIEKCAKENNIDKLLFVARDGYTLQKVFKLLSDVDNEYIYAPRILNVLCNLDYLNSNSDFAACKKNIINVIEEFSNKNLKDENEIDINSISSEFANEYSNYLNDFNLKNSSVAIVDTFTVNYSAQNLISKILNKNILGIYMLIRTFKKGFECFNYNETYVDFEDKNKDNKQIKVWAFFEFLLSSPEYPVRFIKNKKVKFQKSPNEFEKYRAKMYENISNGMLEFANDIKNVLGDFLIDLDFQTIIEWINVYIDNPKNIDKKSMEKIKIGNDAAHVEYVSIFSFKPKAMNYILKPLKTAKALKEAKWRTFFQTFFICLLNILSLKINLKQIKIAFLPYLIKQYLKVNLGIITLIVGNKNG